MHKIVVCGKGGSGKSTVVALLAGQMRARGKRVIVVDADESNPGLHLLLGLPARPLPLMDLLGGKRSVMGSFDGEVEPTNRVLLQDHLRVDELPAEYRCSAQGVTLVTIGKIQRSMEGCACPIGFLSREFLRRLATERDEVVLVDTEAGIEHFGRGVEEGSDGVLVVVDPSYDAMALARQIHDLAREVGLPGALALLNNVPDASLASAMRQQLESYGIIVVGALAADQSVAAAGFAGRPPSSAALERALEPALDRLLRED